VLEGISQPNTILDLLEGFKSTCTVNLIIGKAFYSYITNDASELIFYYKGYNPTAPKVLDFSFVEIINAHFSSGTHISSNLKHTLSFINIPLFVSRP
jgi:hypothetical protein